MSFEGDLLDLIGDSDARHDIRAGVRRCFFYDFDGYPVRLWDGQGKLFAGGQEWLGSIGPEGQNFHVAPAVSDNRDGTSPLYEFTIPYVDAAFFEAMKADQGLARGRDMTCYHVLIKAGEGLIASTALRFNYRLRIRGVKFAESVGGDPASPVHRRSVTAVMRSGEYGRSRVPNGTYTDTHQRERARLLGVSDDDGCIYVAGNARRTFVVGGN